MSPMLGLSIALRINSTGECNAPAAETTIRARTVSCLACSPTVATTPTARPFSINTLSARQFTTISAPASAASFNNHWGVPLSLARMPADARFGVFEIGMNHPDEIRPLVKIVRPHVAVVTLVAPAHLGHFKDVGEIAKAKGEVFEGLVMGGTAVVNADDPQGPALIGMARAAGVDDVGRGGAEGVGDAVGVGGLVGGGAEVRDVQREAAGRADSCRG